MNKTWLVLCMALLIARLPAQDVIVTDPAWFDPENPPAEQLPVFKGRPRVSCPSVMKSLASVECATVAGWVSADGSHHGYLATGSHPYLVDALEQLELELKPAYENGKRVSAFCWFAAVFNPKSAASNAAHSTPRVRRINLVVVPEDKIPKEETAPWVIKAKLNIDERGMLAGFIFENPLHESLRPEVEKSLARWSFSPACEKGRAVPAELLVPLVVVNPPSSLAEDRIAPKLLNKLEAIYPYNMGESGIKGEVLVEYTVTKQGAVLNPVVKRSNNQGFDQAAIDAVMKLKYRPAMANGNPIEAKATFEIFFRIGNLPDAGGEIWTIKNPSGPKSASADYDTKPKVKNAVLPIYPYALLRGKVEGEARVTMFVGASGKVKSIIIDSTTHPEFGAALAAAAQLFQFVPAMKDGRAVESLLATEHVFKQNGGKGVPSTDKKLLQCEENKAESIVSAKKLDAPLRTISQKKPVFPLGLGVSEGQAVVEILVAENGTVHLPRIVEASEPAFGYAAVQAVVEWRFDPPKSGGKPAIVRAHVPFDFKLEVLHSKP